MFGYVQYTLVPFGPILATCVAGPPPSPALRILTRFVRFSVPVAAADSLLGEAERFGWISRNGVLPRPWPAHTRGRKEGW